jgi:hypothetical protein
MVLIFTSPQNNMMNAVTLIVTDGAHFYFSHKIRSITCTFASLFGQVACFLFDILPEDVTKPYYAA